MNASRLCVVLAGGAGERIGGDKPQRRLDGLALGDRALALAAGYADHVALAVRDSAQAEGLAAAPLVFDPPGIEGPLAGVISGLVHGDGLGLSQILTIPCDTPLLPADLYTRLDEALRLCPTSLAATASDGAQDHSACTLWRVEALAPVQAYAQTGRRSLHGVLAALEARRVVWRDPDTDLFLNINTPQQLVQGD